MQKDAGLSAFVCEYINKRKLILVHYLAEHPADFTLEDLIINYSPYLNIDSYRSNSDPASAIGLMTVNKTMKDEPSEHSRIQFNLDTNPAYLVSELFIWELVEITGIDLADFMMKLQAGFLQDGNQTVDRFGLFKTIFLQEIGQEYDQFSQAFCEKYGLIKKSLS